MKFLIALVVVALAVVVSADLSKLNDDQKALAKKYGEECMKEQNVTEEETTKLRNKDFKNPSDNLKCFANCFFEKVGTLKDGQVQEAIILQKLGALIGEDATKQVMTKCNSIKGENTCDTAFKLYECYENAKSEIVA